MNTKIYLNDYYDITDLCLELPLIKTTMIENNSDMQAEFKFNNLDQWLSKDNTNSITRDWYFTKYTISVLDSDTNKTLYKGYISNILTEPNGMATVSCKNDILNSQKQLDKSYFTKDLYEISKLLEDDFGVTFDRGSWGFTSSYFNKATFSVIASTDNKLALSDILSTMSETIGLWIYYYLGELYCYPLYFDYTGYKVEIEKADILNYEYTNSFEDMVNNYKITYSSNYILEDKDGDNLGERSRNAYGEKNKEISGSSSESIVIPDITTAKLIGNNYLNRYKDIFEIITFTVSADVYKYLDLIDKVKIGDKYYIIMDMEYDYGLTTCKVRAWETSG